MSVWGIQHLHRCQEDVVDWVTWALYEAEETAVDNLRGLAKDFNLGEPSPSEAHGGWLIEAQDTDIKFRAVSMDVVGVVKDEPDRGSA